MTQTIQDIETKLAEIRATLKYPDKEECARKVDGYAQAITDGRLLYLGVNPEDSEEVKKTAERAIGVGYNSCLRGEILKVRRKVIDYLVDLRKESNLSEEVRKHTGRVLVKNLSRFIGNLSPFDALNLADAYRDSKNPAKAKEWYLGAYKDFAFGEWGIFIIHPEHDTKPQNYCLEQLEKVV